MKATLKDGTVIDGTAAEIAEVLKRIATPPAAQQLPPLPLPPLPFRWPTQSDRPIPMPGAGLLEPGIIIGGQRRC